MKLISADMARIDSQATAPHVIEAASVTQNPPSGNDSFIVRLQTSCLEVDRIRGRVAIFLPNLTRISSCCRRPLNSMSARERENNGCPCHRKN